MPIDSDEDGSMGSGSGKAPDGDDARTRAERIADAKEHARQRRVEAGLPAEGDDGPYTEAAMAARKGTRKKRR
jgi:hypothetical protein